MRRSSRMPYPTTLKVILWTFKTCVEICYLPVHIIRLFKKSQKCPSIEDKLLLLSAAELAERIRKKQVTSLSVVGAYIARINEVNPLINAVIEDRFEAALQDAERADQLVNNSKLSEEEMKEKYPLLGVPVTIKGSIAVAGMINSSGRKDRNVKAESDAVCVKYAKEAGAVVLLTSNVPELCMNWETRNKRVGRTANPYNTCRTPGGSSGGEASLMASGASLIGIGSDIAGSLRLPAHCCGVWGHKPSPRVVSCAGHYPDCKNRDEWDKVFTLGPMARYAADLKLLLSVIAEPGSKPELKLGETVDVKKIKVYYVEDPQCSLGNRVDTCVINALHRVVAHFDLVCDWRCAKVEMSLMKYCAELSYIRLLDVDDIENLFEGKGEGSYTELFHFLGGQSNHELTTILYGVLRRNLHLIPPKSINKVYRYLDKLRNDLIKMLGNDGVFIMATSPSEASWHGDSIRKLFNCGYLSIFNALGLPVTNCPIGMSRNGLPLGIQVVASPNLDRLTLSVAEEVERAFGGWNFS